MNLVGSKLKLQSQINEQNGLIAEDNSQVYFIKFQKRSKYVLQMI